MTHKKKIIWLVERFYEAVRLTIMTWWIFIKNILFYGLIDVTCYLTSYMIQPVNKRDSIRNYLRRTKVNLKYRKIVSFIASILFIIWFCLYLYIWRYKTSSLPISMAFWIVSAWLIIIGVYTSMLGIVWSTNHFENDVQYYAETFVEILKNPLITLISLTFWLAIYLLGIRNIVVLLLILPGLLIEVKTGVYKKIEEKKKLEHIN